MNWDTLNKRILYNSDQYLAEVQRIYGYECALETARKILHARIEQRFIFQKKLSLYMELGVLLTVDQENYFHRLSADIELLHNSIGIPKI